QQQRATDHLWSPARELAARVERRNRVGGAEYGPGAQAPPPPSTARKRSIRLRKRRSVRSRRDRGSVSICSGSTASLRPRRRAALIAWRTSGVPSVLGDSSSRKLFTDRRSSLARFHSASIASSSF